MHLSMLLIIGIFWEYIVHNTAAFFKKEYQLISDTLYYEQSLYSLDSGVDDIGQIHGRFLSGGSMAIIPEVDKFKIVTEKQWFFVRSEVYASDLFSALFLLSINACTKP